MDEALPVIADTTAMGAPHEIDYNLTFYSDSIGSKSQASAGGGQTCRSSGNGDCRGRTLIFRKQKKSLLKVTGVKNDLTVTMNPAIDKTVEVDKFQPYALNRIRRIEYDAGGKGINVSKTIHALGGESLAMGFLGGNTGKTIENVLNARNIRHDFIYVDGDTRTNTKIFDCVGGVTELNDRDRQLRKISRGTDSENLYVYRQ